MTKNDAAKLRKNERDVWRNWQDMVMADMPQIAIDGARLEYESARAKSEAARREYPFLFHPRR